MKKYLIPVIVSADVLVYNLDRDILVLNYTGFVLTIVSLVLTYAFLLLFEENNKFKFFIPGIIYSIILIIIGLNYVYPVVSKTKEIKEYCMKIQKDDTSQFKFISEDKERLISKRIDVEKIRDRDKLIEGLNDKEKKCFIIVDYINKKDKLLLPEREYSILEDEDDQIYCVDNKILKITMEKIK